MPLVIGGSFISKIKLGELYSKVLKSIPLRVSVTGSRGKSSLVILLENLYRVRGFKTFAKITGDKPRCIVNGLWYPVNRREGFPVVLYENIYEVLKYYPFDVMVIENQAITIYTMKVFNELFVKPDVILVVNIRRDHEDSLGKTKTKIADSIGQSFTSCKLIISGDDNDEVNSVLEKHARRVKAEFVSVKQEGYDLPGIEVVYVANTLMRKTGLKEMTSSEVEMFIKAIENSFSIKHSQIGLDYFHGAKVNDIDSTLKVFNYILNKYPSRRFNILAYFRGDRTARTKGYVEFFNEMIQYDRIDRVLLTGVGSQYVYKRVKDEFKGIFKVVPSDISKIDVLLKDLSRDGNVLFTVGNTVSPYMRELMRRLGEIEEVKGVSTLFSF